MASVETLPADQRAVVELVLKSGRSYDEIASLTRVDRAAVRERALAAFDAIGPQTRLLPEQRALITDYLLGQLPPRVAEHVRERLAQSAPDRAWARVLAGELAPIARNPLPEIPAGLVTRAGAASAAGDPRPAAAEPARAAVAGPARAGAAEPAREEGRRRRRRSREREAPADGKPRSRLGGALLLIVGVAIVLVIVIVILGSGSSKKPTQASVSHTTAAASTPSGTSTPTSSTPTTTTSGSSTTGSGTAHVVSQVNLNPPKSSTATAKGIAQVLRQDGTSEILIYATGIPPNTAHNAYAVWLYNSPSDTQFLGFVNPGIGSNGRLQTAGQLPANASRFKTLLVTLETQAHPRAPGQIVLTGSFSKSP